TRKQTLFPYPRLFRSDRDDFRRQTGQVSLGLGSDFVTAALRDAGLTAAAVRPLPPEPQAKGPALFIATGTRPAAERP
ncbi:MAG: hypothetical protein JWO31_2546, partial [Phycisphaerales bacterium]|nr:hypothetical protein [Phycisphaerales bacterium]